MHDPNLPAGEIVEKREDGTWLRNDETSLEPATTSPHYIVATAFGRDQRQLVKNRTFWNRWMCTGIDEETRQEIMSVTGKSEQELSPFEEEDWNHLRQIINARLSEETALPDPVLASFAGRYFIEPLDLRGFIFRGPLRFNLSHFADAARFEDVYMHASADFSEAHFAQAAVFSRSSSRQGSNFELTHFGRFASFKEIDIATARFRSAQFVQRSDFMFAKFGGLTDFAGTKFGSEADFRSANFLQGASFRGADFPEFVKFDDCIFKAATDFRSASFRKHVPSFFQAELHDNTLFSTRKKLYPLVSPAYSEEHRGAYRQLRRISLNQHNPDNEHFFLRQEMACSAELQDDKLSKWVIKGFGFLSNYGYSLKGPWLGWLRQYWQDGFLSTFA